MTPSPPTRLTTREGFLPSLSFLSRDGPQSCPSSTSTELTTLGVGRDTREEVGGLCGHGSGHESEGTTLDGEGVGNRKTGHREFGRRVLGERPSTRLWPRVPGRRRLVTTPVATVPSP